MTVSVVLSAYNGGLYLESQLKSLVIQTHLPDEIVVIDDCSTDGGVTDSIINQFASEFRFIKKRTNEKNLGWRQSFILGAQLAIGDIVFFCDQDDIWLDNKIEKSLRVLSETNASGVICACQNFTRDEEVRIYGKHTGRVYQKKYPFNNHFIYTKQVGAAMAVRKSFIMENLKFWNPGLSYDGFFQSLLILQDRLVYFDDVLIFHRIHRSNATGKRSFDRIGRIYDSSSKAEYLAALISSADTLNLSCKEKKILGKCFDFQKKRYNALFSKSILKLLLIFPYVSYYPTKKTWFGDLICLLRGRK